VTPPWLADKTSRAKGPSCFRRVVAYHQLSSFRKHLAIATESVLEARDVYERNDNWWYATTLLKQEGPLARDGFIKRAKGVVTPRNVSAGLETSTRIQTTPPAPLPSCFRGESPASAKSIPDRLLGSTICRLANYPLKQEGPLARDVLSSSQWGWSLRRNVSTGLENLYPNTDHPAAPLRMLRDFLFMRSSPPVSGGEFPRLPQNLFRQVPRINQSAGLRNYPPEQEGPLARDVLSATNGGGHSAVTFRQA